MKKLVVVKNICVAVSGLVMAFLFVMAQGIANQIADAKRMLAQELFLAAIPLLIIGMKLVIYDWWAKKARFSYIILAPALCLFGLVCFNGYHLLSADSHLDQKALNELAAQGASLNPTIKEQDRAMWNKLILKAYVCRACNNMPEFSEHLAKNNYPVIVEARDSKEDAAFTAVLGVVSYAHDDNPNPEVLVTPTLYYYVGYQNGARHRYSDTGEGSYRDINGKWQPLVLPDILERGQTYIIEVPDKREFNTVYNTFYLMAQRP